MAFDLVHAVEFSKIGRTRTSTTPTGAASTRGNFSNLDPNETPVKSCDPSDQTRIRRNESNKTTFEREEVYIPEGDTKSFIDPDLNLRDGPA